MKLGIDIGSRYTKIAHITEQGKLDLLKFDSALFYRQYGTNKDGVFSISWDKLGIHSGATIIATGYGRERARLNGAVEVSEIQAHAIGAQTLLGKDTFTMADIGGQDIKVVRVERGSVVDFRTSDRCAASTGRFLENMAQILGITQQKLSEHWKDPVVISSTCAVFAETELLDLLSQGVSVERLAAGVNYAAVRKFAPMICQFPLDVVIITGGVARNNAIITLLDKELQRSLIVPSNSQFTGAIGCLNYEQ